LTLISEPKAREASLLIKKTMFSAETRIKHKRAKPGIESALIAFRRVLLNSLTSVVAKLSNFLSKTLFKIVGS